MMTPPKCRSRARRFKRSRYKRYDRAMREHRFVDAQRIAADAARPEVRKSEYETGVWMGMLRGARNAHDTDN